MSNAALPTTRKPARRFSACTTVDIGSGFGQNTNGRNWHTFARLNGSDGHCAQLRDFPCYVKFSRDGVRNDTYTNPERCQQWENARTAAATNGC